MNKAEITIPVGQVSQSIDVSGFLEMFLVSLLVLGYMSAVRAHHQSLYPTLPPHSPLSFHQLCCVGDWAVDMTEV